MIPMISTYLNNLSMISCIVDKPIIAYVPLNVTSFIFGILPMLSWSCPRTILGRSGIHRKPTMPKKCISIAKSLTDTQHLELEPLHCTKKIKYSHYCWQGAPHYVLFPYPLTYILFWEMGAMNGLLIHAKLYALLEFYWLEIPSEF